MTYGTYGFYHKQDSKKEIIGKGRFENYDDAVVSFAERKQLTIDLFLDLYEVTWLSNYL
jgi:hypothetical protein